MNPNMNTSSPKPPEILELEKIYGIELNELHSNKDWEFEIRQNANCFLCNKSREVIGLNLSGNRIQEIKGLENLVQLTHLYLDSNEITEIQGLEKLINLTGLSLSQNQISQIKGLGNLKKLTDLSLSENEVKEMEGLSKLVNLTHLNLEGNKITDIKNLDNLRFLSFLDLSANQIEEIKGLENLNSLEYLNLSANEINEIKGLENLHKLKTLYLWKNEISEIKGLENLRVLAFLDLGRNRIAEIKGLEALKNLRLLYLANNQIAKITGLENNTKLTHLNLSHNQITQLNPLKEIIQYKHIEYINISENPSSKEIGLDFEDIMNYLQPLKNYFYKSGQETLSFTYPLKIMLLGNHGSGKSSFMDFFIHPKNKLENKNDSTHVLRVVPYSKPAKKTTKNSKQNTTPIHNPRPQAIFYDFGGQDYYHGVYQAFMTNQALSLLFWHKNTNHNRYSRDAEGKPITHYQIEYWLGQHRFFRAKNSTSREGAEETDPLWLIQTHADKDKEEFGFFEEVRKKFYISLKAKNTSGEHQAGLVYLKTLLEEKIRNHGTSQKTKNEMDLFDYIVSQQVLNQHQASDINDLLSIYPKNEPDETQKQDILKGELIQLAQSGLILYENQDGISEKVWLNPTALAQYVHQEVLKKEWVSKGKITQQEFEKNCSHELRTLLQIQKVIFYDAYDQSYIIPNYLPLLKEDGDDFFIFREFHQPDLVLKFATFIPFGYINRLICYFGRNPDRKTYRRNHLVFTLQNKIQIMIHLDFENLRIEVGFRPLPHKSIPAGFVRGFLYELIALYQGDGLEILFNNQKHLEMAAEHPKQKNKSRRINKKNTVDFSLTVKNYAEYQNDILRVPIPDDLYISLNNKDFVNLKELEDETSTQHQIKIYQWNADICTQPYTTTAAGFKTISFNKNLHQMKKIFISYSRQDVTYKDELRKHLHLVKLFGVVNHWACEDINIGNWHEQIQKELAEADLVIMMMSINFFNSWYILEHEILTTMQKMESGDRVKIYPVVVSEFPDINLITKHATEDHLTKALKNLANHQYGMYDKEDKEFGEQTERIFSLREFKMKNKLDWALAKIVEKIVEDITKEKN
jgi:internalin A